MVLTAGGTVDRKSNLPRRLARTCWLSFHTGSNRPGIVSPLRSFLVPVLIVGIDRSSWQSRRDEKISFLATGQVYLSL
jgi:hypothetical protein